MTIILVLPRVPGYSETFFQNKIRFLSSEGYKIIVVGANPSRITFDGASIIEPLAFEGGITFNSFISMVRALFHILFSLTKSYRFIQLEIETGRSKKEAVKNLFDITGQPVIVTLGSRGTLYYTGDKQEVVPAVEVKAIDTIGAGDSHTAAVIAGLASGYDIRRACILANETAAKVVQHVGCCIA